MLAKRLAEDPDNQVLLVEAGGKAQRWFDFGIPSSMPSAFYLPIGNPYYDWCFRSTPQSRLNDRRITCPRGRVIGGSSAINGMVYVRGHREDFERWQTLGASGWGYADVLPYFRKAERATDPERDSAYRGETGPLVTTTGALTNPLHSAFLAAAKEAGYPLTDDLNGRHQEGFGTLPMTVENGVRCSVAKAYLSDRPANLHILSGHQAQHLRFQDRRCIGAELRAPNGQRVRLSAGRTILACGAIGSPQLLMLSGIGPAAALRELDIPVRADRSEVGENLRDHLEVYVQNACTAPVTLNSELGLLGKARIGLEWLLTRRGLGASNHFETGGFIRSGFDQGWPDIQYHFLPAAMTYAGDPAGVKHGFQAHVGPMSSEARGTVRLRTNKASDEPLLNFNYMSGPNDWQVFRAAVRSAREIFAQDALRPFAGNEISPGAQLQTDEELDAFIRNHAESAYHPCGTCRMGSDAQAVVDPQGKVNEIEDLWVADASIFPHLTNGNLNAPTIMLAEKIADHLKGGALPPLSPVS